jgi:hypothetical protein
LRESLGLAPSEFAQHFLGRKRRPLTSQSVWNWENGDNPPSAENYIRMGDIAPDPEQAIYFWSAAGIDPQRVARAVAEADKRRAAQPHGKKPKADSPAACW